MEINEIDKYQFQELCKVYGYILNDEFREKISVMLNFPIYGDITCFPEEENVLAIAEFLDYLRSVGNRIMMDGEIENPRHGQIKNTKRVYTIDNAFLKDRLLFFLSDLLQEITIGRKIYDVYPEESLQAEIKMHKEKTDNKRSIPEGAEKGAKVWRIYSLLWDAELFHLQGKFLQKEWCFIYDCALLAGWKIENIGKGFTSLIGREKAQKIRDWLRAYQKYDEKITE